MRILVTGCAGFIGLHTLRVLLKDGHHVLGIDNFRSSGPTNLSEFEKHKNFSFLRKDILSSSALDPFAEKRIDSILHLSALVSVAEAEQKPELSFKLNVEATQRILEFARRTETKRVVLASSAAVYGDALTVPIIESFSTKPEGNYGYSKLISEHLLQQYHTSYNIETVALRYFNVYGPGQPADSPYSGVITKFNALLKENRAPKIFGDGSQTRDFIHVSDIAQANSTALTMNNIESGAYNVCSGESTSVNQVFEALQSQHASPVFPVYENSRPGEIEHSLGSGQKLFKETGFKPQVKMAQGIKTL